MWRWEHESQIAGCGHRQVAEGIQDRQTADYVAGVLMTYGGHLIVAEAGYIKFTYPSPKLDGTWCTVTLTRLIKGKVKPPVPA